MFERFTPDARQVVVRAQQEARNFAHPWLGTEHLLLGVLDASGEPAAAVLGDLGITLDTARDALGHLVGRGGFCANDAAALRTVGIDLEQVRRAAEANFGPGALDRPVAQCRRRASLFRRRRVDDSYDGLPFMPRAKRVLERARNEAKSSGVGDIDVDHLLLGLLDPKGNMAVELIRHLGADPELVRARLRARRDTAA
ncbi:MAG TPA: Clp protease N-terminal domain-containing protein [Jatrophihabitans sp.]|nr:Clp protease N-terminal domain-containing protein [Jatrophihabitans sp.]